MPGKNFKLRTLFKRRQDHFKSVTDQIMERLEPVVLKACADYVIKHDHDAESRIKWKAVSLTKHYGMDTISLFGTIEYREGEEFTDSRGVYVASLTATEAEHVSTTFQVVIPFTLAEKASYEEILDYLAGEDKKVEDTLNALLNRNPDDDDAIFDSADLSEEEIALAKLVSSNTIQ